MKVNVHEQSNKNLEDLKVGSIIGLNFGDEIRAHMLFCENNNSERFGFLNLNTGVTHKYTFNTISDAIEYIKSDRNLTKVYSNEKYDITLNIEKK